jgi:PEP-CTERM/exosortase A-associated glycosyltransferase
MQPLTSTTEAAASSATDAPTGKVLHVFDHSFPIGDGYSNRSGEIVRFTRRLGWQTIHLTSAKQGPARYEQETVNGLEFFRTRPAGRPWNGLPVVNQWLVVATLRRRLEMLLRSEQPVLLHVHSPCLNALAALPVACRRHIPLIYEVRALWEDGAADSGTCREGDLRYRLSRTLETHVCRRADHVVTICDGLQREMLDRGVGADKITVAPNSVDLARFGAARTRDEELAAQLGLTTGKTFGFIGSFFPFEGLDVLLRAVPLILAREPEARFVIVGDGPDAPRVRTLARELGIEAAVILTGRVPHVEVERYYGLIDVLVYPRISNRVTELVTPLKPLEAMAQSKLVIASDVGGHREMVFPGRNGLLFEAGNAGSLAHVGLGLLSRPGDWPALRQGGRSYVEGFRSWECNAGIYDRLYRRLLCGPAAAIGNGTR